MLAQSRAFFALPVEAKRTVLANKLNRGYTPFEEEVCMCGSSSRGQAVRNILSHTHMYSSSTD